MAHFCAASVGASPLPMDTSHIALVHVQSQVGSMNASGAQTSNSRDRSFQNMSVQHGNAERGRRTRERDRDRSSSARQGIRMTAAGPQEQQDWLHALAIVCDRLDTVERVQRLHAQSIAHGDEVTTSVGRKLRETINDIDAYKKFMTDTHKVIDNFIEERTQLMQAQLD